MQNKFIAGVILTLLFSCGLNKNKIMLDHKTEYLRPENFEEIHTTQTEIDSYKSLFENNNTDNSLVLYKTLKYSNIKIYIGICYNTDKIKVKTKIQNSLSSNIYVDTTKFNNFTICTHHTSSAYILHYFLELESGNKYLFSVISEDSRVANPDFIERYIKSRITSN